MLRHSLWWFIVLTVLLAALLEVESKRGDRRRKRPKPTKRPHHTHRPKPPKPSHRPKPTRPKPCTPRHCVVSAWSFWHACSVACGKNGIQTRARKFLHPATCGGQCPYETRQFRDCNRFCQNGGTLRDTRCDCLPQYGGQCCEEVNGGWSCWGEWETCGTTCGGGIQRRVRACDNPTPTNLGRQCTGSSTESQECNTAQCPVNGNWAPWEAWSHCSVTCGGGTQKRSRSCTNPPTSHGGQPCVGPNEMTQECNKDLMCPVDGNWSSWGDWGGCSETCGGGTQKRSRSCTNPPTSHGGKPCVGPSEMTQECNKHVICPVDGSWSPWEQWSQCSATCGGGVRRRFRSCTSPPTAHGGKPCTGRNETSEECNQLVTCPVDGGWSSWGDWGQCNRSCVKKRSRGCTRPPPSSNGRKCTGPPVQTAKCSFDECTGGNGGGGRNENEAEDTTAGTWGPWSDWSECTRSCGDSSWQFRSRTCAVADKACPGEGVQVQACHVEPCNA